MKTISALFIIVMYLLISTYFVFNISTHHHMHNVNCHYVIGSDSLCSTNIFDFLNKFQKVFSVTFSYFVFYIILFSYFVILYVLINLSTKRLIIYLKNNTNNIQTLYNWLYSDGILNGKPY